MAYIVKQIKNIVIDSVKDALGKTASATKIETTDLVSLGKQLSELELYEGWFGALVNRIAKTQYFIRVYNPKNDRRVLRDEYEFGAFVQKVYYKMPDPVDNPAYKAPVNGEITQSSPYDVKGTVAVHAAMYGTKGTWSVEIVRPMYQIETAFTSNSEMMRFIDGIYVAIENSIKLELERVVNLAVNTAIADTLHGGYCVNLLQEYNLLNANDAITNIDDALRSKAFHKFCAKEIMETIDHMGNMSTLFNKQGYETFTERGTLVVEMLDQFKRCAEVYLESDTYHNELVSLPAFSKVSFWQASGKRFSFTDCSKINIEHDDIGVINQGGIVCFAHDTENVAACFGRRRSWEKINERDDLVIHGEKLEKGYAIDNHANAVVFYLSTVGTVTLTGSTHITLASNINFTSTGYEIIVTPTIGSGYEVKKFTVGSTELEPDSTGKYHYIPTSNANLTFAVTEQSAS